MNKTLSLNIALAIAVVGFATAAAPAQAANRLMVSSVEGFEHRCEKHGGAYVADGALVSCNTPSILVSCDYFSAERASCNWAGNERQIDVIRVIGTLPMGGGVASSGGSNDSNANTGGGNVNNGGNGGGGFQGPKDIKDAPNDNPNPGFNGPPNFKLAP